MRSGCTRCSAAEPARNLTYQRLPLRRLRGARSSSSARSRISPAYYNGTVIISGDDLPERYTGGFVTLELHARAGREALLGRDFAASGRSAERRAGRAPVATTCGARASTRTRTIIGRIGARQCADRRTIIGVMPQGFAFPDERDALGSDGAGSARQVRRGDQSYENPVGVTRRRAPRQGRDAPRRRAEDIGGIAARLAKLYPRTNAGLTTQVVPIAAGVDRRRQRDHVRDVRGRVARAAHRLRQRRQSHLRARELPRVRGRHARRARRAPAAARSCRCWRRASSSA